MRISIPPPTQPAPIDALPIQASRRAIGAFARTPLTIFVAALAAFLCCAPLLFADQPQAPAAPPAVKKAQKPAHPRKHPAAVQPAAPPPQPVAVAAPPPAPELPKWPVNEKPADATVTWDSQGLRIDAANSSLHQILKDFCVATGAKVEGLTADQRVFGVYGPGQARDVLTALLEGSGYNLLMVGDQGQGAPREIVLSPRQAATTTGQPSASSASAKPAEDEPDIDDQPQPAPAPANAPQGHSRVPPRFQAPGGFPGNLPPNQPPGNSPN